MHKQIINSWTWQAERGYDQAIEISGFDRLLICSGQSSVDADGNVLHPGDMRGQIEVVMQNIQTVLTEAGYSWQDIIKIKWYTTDLEQLWAASDVFETMLGTEQIRAAQSVYIVSELAMPGLMLEIEVTAAK